ncbi:unnamed protein product [Paramecium pentaurelia]|uniref:Uncharacterized protein n=1 Tax=Paramecium pentaurelia TaxID=43138 RepID=A0A8S1WRA9_9CILI|nr:unnamed protein product [Paramecium pentaurelia]
MNNSLILNQSYCKTEGDELYGSRALDILKEKMKIFDLEKIPQLSQLQRERLRSKQRSKTQKLQIHSNSKQPTNYSQYRISNKEQTFKPTNDMFSRQTIESIKSRLSIQEAKLLDVPIIKISRERPLTNNNDSSNTMSLILMEKYYQSTLKYQQRQMKQQQKQTKKPNTSINSISQIITSNQAVKNYKRKLRNSRRDLMKEIPQQYPILNHSRQFSSDKSNQEYSKTTQIQSKYSSL